MGAHEILFAQVRWEPTKAYARRPQAPQAGPINGLIPPVLLSYGSLGGGARQGLLVVQPPDRQGWTSVEPHRSSVGSQVNRNQSRLVVNKINGHTINRVH